MSIPVRFRYAVTIVTAVLWAQLAHSSPISIEEIAVPQEVSATPSVATAGLGWSLSKIQGIPAEDRSVRCPFFLSDVLKFQAPARSLGDQLSGYQVNERQLKRIRQRCGIEGGKSVVRVVESDADLICAIATRNAYALRGDMVLLMPGDEYRLHEGASLVRNDQGINFCGVRDLIAEDAFEIPNGSGLGL